jgi:hypothetical protein
VPLASALVAHRDRYFDLLNSYRRGRVRSLVESFAAGALVAASQSRATAQRLRDIPTQWRDLVGPIRSGSAAADLLALLPSRPILSSDDVRDAIAAPTSSVYAAIERLHRAGVLRPLTERKGDQVWGASLILDELADLGVRIAAAAPSFRTDAEPPGIGPDHWSLPGSSGRRMPVRVRRPLVPLIQSCIGR